MEIKTVGIIGHGAFGALVETLLRRFAPSIEVRAYDTKKGKSSATLAEAAACDAVVLSVPIAEFEHTLTDVVPLTRPDTVIVDVSTVKVHTTALLKKLALSQRRRYISTHPVWGPESYEKRGGDISGFRIVMTDGTLEVADYTALSAFLTKCGFDVVEMSAEAHDKHLAETLFLTHFIGQLVSSGGFKRTEVDTVSFGYLMDAVESVKNDAELFRDVFRFDPYCADVLGRFAKAEFAVRESLSTSEPKRGESQGRSLRIGISGAKGSFSEEAAREYAKGAGLKDFSLDYLISVENVLAALEKGDIDLGIFPIANSTGGVVTEAEAAVAKHRFSIRKLFGIDIRQNLLAQKGVSKGEITTIVSHDQALKQCRAYLKKNWPQARLQEYEDTAKAAEDLASGALPSATAVIASYTAAEVYRLEVLEASIQDLTSNFTTFLAVEPAR
ncbi:MAG: prephenate dehydrogenase/arogenate dehydrogenase family protein [Patescibacteria group bacterium]